MGKLFDTNKGPARALALTSFLIHFPLFSERPSMYRLETDSDPEEPGKNSLSEYVAPNLWVPRLANTVNTRQSHPEKIFD